MQLLDNPAYVADLKSAAQHETLAQKWSTSEASIRRHRRKLKITPEESVAIPTTNTATTEFEKDFDGNIKAKVPSDHRMTKEDVDDWLESIGESRDTYDVAIGYSELKDGLGNVQLIWNKINGRKKAKNAISTVDFKDLADRVLNTPVEVHSHARESATKQSYRAFVPSDLQLGKGLESSTSILTTSGWKTHGELTVGDYVYGKDGLPKRVNIVHETTVRDLYRVTLADGTSLVCDEKHLWPVSRKMHSKGYGSDPSVGAWERRDFLMTAPQIKKVMSQKSYSIRSIAVDAHDPVQIEHSDLPFDPYLLGVWLGDGNRTSGRVSFGEQDASIFGDIPHKSFTGSSGSKMVGATIPGMAYFIHEYGLYKNKHVPEAFIYSSVDQRVALLQGLFDTDGYCTSGGMIEFSNTNKQVVDSVLTILHSLGVYPHVYETVGKLYGVEKKPVRRVTFRSTIPMFRLERKLSKQRESTERKHIQRTITDVEFIGPGEAQCITVDGGLYLAGKEMVTTHNCDAAGGVEVTLKAFNDSLEYALRKAEEHRTDHVVIIDPGDALEGFHNVPSQHQTNCLNLTQQIELVYLLFYRAISAFQTLGVDVSLVTVPSNHCQVKVGKQQLASTPNDDYGILVNRQLEIAFGNSRNVHFIRPENEFSETAVFEGANTKIAVIHGHQTGSPDKIGEWWKGQDHGRLPSWDADILVTGHWHSFRVQQSGDARWILVAPSLEPSSSWFANLKGESSERGALHFTFEDGRWYDVEIL